MTTFDAPVPSAPQGRFDGIERPYSATEVERLRGSLPIRTARFHDGTGSRGDQMAPMIREGANGHDSGKDAA